MQSPQKATIPHGPKCVTDNIIYKANIASDLRKYKEQENPTEITKKSFNLVKYKYYTELSKEYWRRKSLKGTPEIKWTIVKKCAPYSKSTKRCSLCMNKKYETAFCKGENF